MTFDKKQYWENKRNKVRFITPSKEIDYKELDKEYNPSSGPNRRMKRDMLFRNIDRTYTKKGYFYGIRIGSRQDGVMHHIAKRQGL